MDGIKRKIKDLFTKIKSIKHIEIIIAIVAVALMILVFSSGKKLNGSQNEEPVQQTTESPTDAIGIWEQKLSEILSKIDGVGKTNVMITAESTVEKITSNTMSTATTVSGNGANTTTNVTQSPVIVTNSGKSEPYIIKENMPEIIGVIVVAEGADNAVTKLAIMRAVQTALKVDSSCVEIYPMK